MFKIKIKYDQSWPTSTKTFFFFLTVACILFALGVQAAIFGFLGWLVAKLITTQILQDSFNLVWIGVSVSLWFIVSVISGD